MNDQAKIRMHNGLTYTVKEILSLWSEKVAMIPTMETREDWRGTYQAKTFKRVYIEEMVRITIEEGSYNPKNHDGSNLWGLSMELVSMPTQPTQPKPENKMNNSTNKIHQLTPEQADLILAIIDGTKYHFTTPLSTKKQKIQLEGEASWANDYIEYHYYVDCSDYTRTEIKFYDWVIENKNILEAKAKHLN